MDIGVDDPFEINDWLKIASKLIFLLFTRSVPTPLDPEALPIYDRFECSSVVPLFAVLENVWITAAMDDAATETPLPSFSFSFFTVFKRSRIFPCCWTNKEPMNSSEVRTQSLSIDSCVVCKIPLRREMMLMHSKLKYSVLFCFCSDVNKSSRRFSANIETPICVVKHVSEPVRLVLAVLEASSDPMLLSRVLKLLPVLLSLTLTSTRLPCSNTEHSTLMIIHITPPAALLTGLDRIAEMSVPPILLVGPAAGAKPAGLVLTPIAVTEVAHEEVYVD